MKKVATWEKVGNHLECERITRVGIYFKCSNCGYKVFAVRTENGYKTSNYCPNCGAEAKQSK